MRAKFHLNSKIASDGEAYQAPLPTSSVKVTSARAWFDGFSCPGFKAWLNSICYKKYNLGEGVLSGDRIDSY